MSHIIAFVQFSVHGNLYPVECFRTDVGVGDEVLVLQPNRPLTRAEVVEVRYLGWNCPGKIRGKVSEAVRGTDGYWSLQNCPTAVGMTTNEVFIAEVKHRGWVPLKRNHVHSAALTNSNATDSANILVRTNGIDLQILPTRRKSLPRPFEFKPERFSEGRAVRHYFSHTILNLYEWILCFSDSFMSNEGNYDQFFNSVGSSDRRTEELKQAAEARKRAKGQRREEDGLSDYYDAVSDESGGSVYAGDGMWIDSGGSLHD